MKYLFLLLVILVVIWAIKRSRIGDTPNPKNDTPAATPSNMVICAHCGIHLPQEEAVSGVKGTYCSTEHRSAAQDRNPA
ncbi:hypothetical protein B9Z47_03710 [Limnohabitans sp. 2KL-1]|jgi:uncharacterized protein|uniref:PP0621 family protein n=1 Tax=Limnohabitans sp. 2KL-1 TaxID=1100699 RepID=UPI000D3623A6|nr:PP0621 family protein [Limnohabitans sp. 2KL-1]PUE50842.1 hypothetical protein B9Z47_03710 [Limnohabitans sp. 2KL-1]